jgi:hypothetical protein
VTWASSDTATATALVAHQRHQGPAGDRLLGGRSGHGGLDAGGTGSTNTAGNSITLAGTGTGVTVSGAILSNGGTTANVLIKALVPGTIGNGITLALSGTGETAPSGARWSVASAPPATASPAERREKMATDSIVRQDASGFVDASAPTLVDKYTGKFTYPAATTKAAGAKVCGTAALDSSGR